MDLAAFKAWRQRLNLTRSQAAERLGVARGTIRNWEGGKSPIPRMAELACQAITSVGMHHSDSGRVMATGGIFHADSHDESALSDGRLVRSEARPHDPTILDSSGAAVCTGQEISPQGGLSGVAPQAPSPPGASQDDPRPCFSESGSPTAWWEAIYGSGGVTGRQVKAGRALLGWSQAELARASAVSTTTIMHFETGQGSIQRRTVSKLRYTLESAGIEFLQEEGRYGVRLRAARAP